MSLVPLAPTAGPIFPTEKRSYFLPHQFSHFLADEHERIKGSMHISISSGAGEEMRLDDEHTVDALEGIVRMARSQEVLEIPLDGPDAHVPRSGEANTDHEIRMHIISHLLKKRIAELPGETFDVYGPQVLLDDPTIASAESAGKTLEHQPFAVAFKDGTRQRLTFKELMMFTYLLIETQVRMSEVASQIKNATSAPGRVTLKTRIREDELLSGPMVIALLDKLEFAETSSESLLKSSSPG